ncbi:MAG TPA: hypothetical protein VIB48_04145 [Acidimicrobiia bacterium]
MQDVSQAWSKVIAKAWSDDQFKSQLMSNPTPILEQYGLGDATKGYAVKVIEDPNAHAGDWHIQGRGPNATYVVALPPKPSGELSDSELESVAGAGCTCCCCTGAASGETL